VALDSWDCVGVRFLDWPVGGDVCDGMAALVDAFYSGIRWRLLRRCVLAVYGRQCMKCGRKWGPIQVDHIVARARGWFGRKHQYQFSNMQVLCRDCNMEKGVGFADYRPFWARLLMPAKDR